MTTTDDNADTSHTYFCHSYKMLKCSADTATRQTQMIIFSNKLITKYTNNEIIIEMRQVTFVVHGKKNVKYYKTDIYYFK